MDDSTCVVTKAAAAVVADTEATCLTLRDWGSFVLRSEDPDVKAAATLRAHALWESGVITDIGPVVEIDEPGRPSNVEILPPGKMPRRGFGSERGRAAMIHALVHVECVAIDLSWDIALRFERGDTLPRQFFSDWVRVAKEEATHYSLLRDRLREGYGMVYGDFPAHGGLWKDALATKDSLFGRLAIEHCVHEARGLDITRLQTIPKFERNGDAASADLLRIILRDEVTHTRDGCTWFKYLCVNDLGLVCDDPEGQASDKAGNSGSVSDVGADASEADVCAAVDSIAAKFHEVVQTYYRGKLKGPFSKQDRAAAGMPTSWYIPLSDQAGR
eukprot:m.42849 g.42849  ORF g.42849 m.42849 type:complete len:330 (-) comp11586_c1_seq1:332-1321(-)